MAMGSEMAELEHNELGGANVRTKLTFMQKVYCNMVVEDYYIVGLFSKNPSKQAFYR